MSGSLSPPPVAGQASNWLNTVKQPDLASTLGTVQQILQSRQQIEQSKQQVQNLQQELQNLQLTNQTGQTNLAYTKRVNAAKTLYSLNAQDDAGMMKDAPSVLEGLRADNNITDAHYQQVKSDIDNGDVKSLRRHISSGIVVAMSGPEALAAVAGQTGTTTTAGPDGLPVTQGFVQPGVLSPDAGALQPRGAGLRQVPSAGDMAEVITVKVPGQPDITGSRGALMAKYPQFFGISGSPSTAAASAPSAGAPNPLGAAPTQTTPSAPAPVLSGPVATPLGLTDTLDKSRKAYTVDQTAYNAPNGGQTMIANTKEAYELGELLGNGGPGTKMPSAIAARVATLGRAMGITGPISDWATARASLDKVDAQILAQSPLAGQSAAHLGVSEEGTPHTGMDYQAMQDQMRLLYGQTKQHFAPYVQQARAGDLIGNNHLAITNDIGPNTDREGFAADLLTAAQIKKRVEELGGPKSESGKKYIRALKLNRTIYNSEPR